MIKGAIFDVDGTLLDSMFIWDDASDRYLISRGYTPQPGLRQAIAEMSIEEGCEYVKKLYSLPESVSELKEGVLAIVEDFYAWEAVEKPGVRKLLMKLRQMGIPCCIATTGDRELVKKAMTRLGLDSCFTEILTCSELSTTKREALIYLTAAEHMGLEPCEVCVFEDALHAVKTAAGGGFFTVAVDDPSARQYRAQVEAVADMFLESLEDFTDYSIFM